MPYHGGGSRGRPTDRENPRRAARLQNGADHLVDARPDPNPDQGPKSAHEQMASQVAAATPTAALAAPSAATVAAAQTPPVAAPPVMANAHPPPAAPLPPLATAQPPPYPPWPPVISLITGKKAHIFGHHADSQTGGLNAVSYAMRKATSPIAALLALCCSACCDSKPEKPLMVHQEVRFSSFLHHTATRAPPRGI